MEKETLAKLNMTTETIDVKAVADAPTVSLSVTPDTNNPTSTGSNGNGNSGSNENNGFNIWWNRRPSLKISSDWWNGDITLSNLGNIVQSATYEKDEVI